MTYTTHSLSPRQPVLVGSGLHTFTQRLHQTIRQWLQKPWDITSATTLADLSPHLLRDINVQPWTESGTAYQREAEHYERIRAMLPWQGPL